MKIDLSNSEWKLMNRLWQTAPMTITELTAALREDTGWSKNTVITMLSRLEGKQLTSHTQAPVELHGSRRLRPEEIIFSDEISELDGRLNFYMDCSFNPDEVFGTHVDSADNNNWLNIYAEYDLENSQVCDALKVILCREDGFDYEMAYQLNAEEKSAILDKMGQYCREKYGQSLLEFAAEMESEITAMETPQM